MNVPPNQLNIFTNLRVHYPLSSYSIPELWERLDRLQASLDRLLAAPNTGNQHSDLEEQSLADDIFDVATEIDARVARINEFLTEAREMVDAVIDATPPHSP